ncbi:MAG: hypothetical protein GY696_34955, partial [Gammaproteobacteria bacterium]|nr:hypothetical protein [Gammaproteobacteria bacterium]
MNETTAWTNSVADYALVALDPDKYCNYGDTTARGRHKVQLARCCIEDVLPAMLGDDMVRTVALQWGGIMRETPTSIDTTIPVMVKNSILTRLENGARKRSVQAALLWPGGVRKD